MIHSLATEIYHQNIYRFDKSLSNNRMEQKEIWRQNLRLLVATCEKKKDAAEKLDMEPSRLNHMIGPNPIRNVSAETARLAEEAFGVARYWMDSPRTVADLPKESTIYDDSVFPEMPALLYSKKPKAEPAKELAGPAGATSEEQEIFNEIASREIPEGIREAILTLVRSSPKKKNTD